MKNFPPQTNHANANSQTPHSPPELSLPSKILQDLPLLSSEAHSSAILSKRRHPGFEDVPLEIDPHKKLKTTLPLLPQNTAAFLLNQPNILPQQNSINFQQQNLQNFVYHRAIEIMKLQEMMHLNYLYTSATKISTLNDPIMTASSFPQNLLSQPVHPLKEISLENNLPTTKSNPQKKLHEEKTSKSGVIKLSQNFSPGLIEESALSMFTRSFPDWDLATIFAFISSEQSLEDFEKHRKVKTGKKVRRKRVQKPQQ